MFRNRWSDVGEFVLAGHRALAELIRSGDIQTASNAGHRTFGREAEGTTVCRTTGQPAPIVPDLLQLPSVKDLAVTEVHRAMVEFNKPYMVLKPGVFRDLAAKERVRFAQFRQAARQYDADLLFAGTSPGASWEHFSLAWYVDKPRYWQLLEGLAAVHGNDGVYDIELPAPCIESPHRVRKKMPFSAAGAVQSDQLQIQMAPAEVGAMVNWAHVLMGPLAAIFSNATCFGGELLPSASIRPQLWACVTAGRSGLRRLHNYFLDCWLPENDTEAFIRWTEQFCTGHAVVDCLDPDPLNCLKLFMSKWPWIRPKFDVEPVPNVRMEIRGIDKLFTAEDCRALYAVYLGALTHATKRGLDVRDYVTTTEARYNFFAGAHYGVLRHDGAEHELHWRGGRATARTIVRDFILPWADTGLELMQFGKDEREAALYPLRRVAQGDGLNGAEWLRQSHAKLTEGGLTPLEIGKELVRAMLERAWSQEKPTCDWSVV